MKEELMPFYWGLVDPVHTPHLYPISFILHIRRMKFHFNSYFLLYKIKDIIMIYVNVI